MELPHGPAAAPAQSPATSTVPQSSVRRHPQADIHDYTHRLLDSFGDEDFDDAARKEAMSPGAFRRFLAKRGRAA